MALSERSPEPTAPRAASTRGAPAFTGDFALVLSDVTKRFGKQVAVDRLDGEPLEVGHINLGQPPQAEHVEWMLRELDRQRPAQPIAGAASAGLTLQQT